jgi:hypothetical protein
VKAAAEMRRNKKPIKPRNHCLPSPVIIKKNAKLKAEIAPVTRPAKMETNLFDRNSTISLIVCMINPPNKLRLNSMQIKRNHVQTRCQSGNAVPGETGILDFGLWIADCGLKRGARRRAQGLRSQEPEFRIQQKSS